MDKYVRLVVYFMWIIVLFIFLMVSPNYFSPKLWCFLPLVSPGIALDRVVLLQWWKHSVQQQSCEKAHIRQQQQALLVRRESHSTAPVQDEKSDLVGVSYKEKTITIF